MKEGGSEEQARASAMHQKTWIILITLGDKVVKQDSYCGSRTQV